MTELINQLTPDEILFWHWWAGAVALLLLEAMLPGAFFLWMAIAAAIVGVLLLAIPSLGGELQIMLFSVTSVVTIIGAMQWRRGRPKLEQTSTLNRRGQQFVGETFVLNEAVVSGRGKLILDDTRWGITGPDCPAGSRILITELTGGSMKFEIVAD
ncbi:MAG: NfeD family protein [Immundisolibacteraceae bacterium]|nr:NfeD family protein [Immundisolibacteraceae bacterium]